MRYMGRRAAGGRKSQSKSRLRKQLSGGCASIVFRQPAFATSASTSFMAPLGRAINVVQDINDDHNAKVYRGHVDPEWTVGQ
jgi:hypothetical protein